MGRAPHPGLRRLGQRIRQVRLERGLSQEALAHGAGLDRSYMSGIERGARNVTVLKLYAIARALGVPVRALFPDE